MLLKSLSKTLFFIAVLLCLTPFSLLAADFNVADYKGKVVYLDFWASWCKPCKESFPWMNKLYEQHGGDLEVIAVNLDANREDANKFLEKVPAYFPILFDPEGTLAEKYKIQGMPTSILFDRNGNLIAQETGFVESKIKHYEAKINEQLMVGK